MRTTAIINLKGGVAKTTTALNMAAILAKDYKQRVLLVDADSQCNCTEFFQRGIAHPGTLADMLRGLAPCIEHSRFDGVDLLPGDDSLMDLDLTKIETEVLAACNRNGFRFVCPTIYEDGTVLTQNSIWNWYDLDNYGTYSEENDDYFIPEGWWENRQFTPDDVYNSPVDCPVTHWMPLPLPPDRISENRP